MKSLVKVKTRKKAMGPDDIPMEAWNCVGEIGSIWLTRVFNKIKNKENAK